MKYTHQPIPSSWGEVVLDVGAVVCWLFLCGVMLPACGESILRYLGR